MFGGFIWWTSAPPPPLFMAIMGPVTSGGAPTALAQPTDQDVLKALENTWLVGGMSHARKR
jgi:hypothetical protein